MEIKAEGLDLQDLWEQVAEAYLTIIDDQFKTEGAAYGEKWKKSNRVREADERQSERLARGEGAGSENVSAGQTLQASGALRNSPTFLIYGGEIVFTSNLIYSRIHREGGKITPKEKKVLRFIFGGAVIFASEVNMPQRDFMPVNEKVEEELQAEVVEILTRSANARIA